VRLGIAVAPVFMTFWDSPIYAPLLSDTMYHCHPPDTLDLIVFPLMIQYEFSHAFGVSVLEINFPTASCGECDSLRFKY
jgi:hypothetical protein